MKDASRTGDELAWLSDQIGREIASSRNEHDSLASSTAWRSPAP
jgi:hypothetical protein